MLVVAVNIDLFNHAPPSDKCSSVLANTEWFPQRHYIDKDINFMLDCVTLFDKISFTCGDIMLRVTFCFAKKQKSRDEYTGMVVPVCRPGSVVANPLYSGCP